MRRITASNERSVLERLNEKYAQAEKPPEGPTFQEAQTAEADRIAAFNQRETKRREDSKKSFADLFEHATQAARTVEAGDTEMIEAKGAKVLQAALEDLLGGKGGFSVEREEVRPIKAHKHQKNDRYAITDEALIAYQVHILLPSGGTKVAKCVVAFDGSVPVSRQFQVQDIFFDSMDKKRPFTPEGLRAYLDGIPAEGEKAVEAEEFEDDRPVVFFNSDDQVLGYETLDMPKKAVVQAVKKIQDAGFDVQTEYLDLTTGMGRQAHVVDAAPERHDELRSIVAAIVEQWDDTTWFDRAMGDHDKYGQSTIAPEDGWFDRTQQKEDMPNQPHDWFERSTEKPEQEGIASSAYDGTKMLRFERKKKAQAKKPDQERKARKQTRQAKRRVKAEKKSQATVLDAADRMAKLAKRTQRPF